jgi:sulfite reductase alpha subunit-like flavoprotein
LLHGVEVQAPVARLRFTMPDSRTGFLRWLGTRTPPRFEAGDLVGILPPGSDVPRYYSIASSSRDGDLEICVRKVQNRLLDEGAAIQELVRRGAQIMVCGGREMANGVREAVDACLAPGVSSYLVSIDGSSAPD